MAMGGFDLGLLIENAGFVPQAEILDASAREAVDTLDWALGKQISRAPTAEDDAILDRAEIRDGIAAPDLWIGAGRIIRAPHINFDTSGSAESAFILRDLSKFEKSLVAGAWGPAGVTVTGPENPWEPGLPNDPDPDGPYDGGQANPNPPPENEFDDPDCDKANAITNPPPLDNAKYFVPENVDKAYIDRVLNHLSEFAGSHSAVALLEEFRAMYTNPANAYFIDFKDWGTPAGPAGSSSGGTTTYYSPAAGHEVTGSVFEAFGNWFYGFAGTWAGISPDVLYAAAALLQEGDTGFIPHDAPEDQPHVSAGIAAAKNWSAHPNVSILNVEIGNCATGTTSSIVGTSGLAGPVSHGTDAAGNAYRASLWAYFEGWHHEVYP